MGVSDWFPVGKNDEGGWRLDIVSLLAVIGESSIEEHSQALTSSWTCILPRIIPAPQVLLKPSRPTRMPQVNAAVVGVHNGTLVPTLNYFPNILHPIEELTPFMFKVLKITRKKPKDTQLEEGQHAHDETKTPTGGSANIEPGVLEDGPQPIQRQSTFKTIARMVTMAEKDKPRVPPQLFSPLNIISVVSCIVTMGLIIWAALISDGTAIVALGTISLASSIVGYASWWAPVLMTRTFKSKVPAGDVIIRTREGAFLLVKCDEEVARELYTGTEECHYYVKTQQYRVLVGFGTFLLMISVVLLGNCNFTMQAAIGLSYIILNGTYWGVSLINKHRFWDLSNYTCEDVTPRDASNAHVISQDSLEGMPSFTRTMWYAIRETKKIGWVKRGGAAPQTEEWSKWLKLAEENAVDENRAWKAVEWREKIVGQAETTSQSQNTPSEAVKIDPAEQHVPAYEVPPPEKR